MGYECLNSFSNHCPLLFSWLCLSRVMLVLLVLPEVKVLLASRVCLVNVVLLVCLVPREIE